MLEAYDDIVFCLIGQRNLSVGREAVCVYPCGVGAKSRDDEPRELLAERGSLNEVINMRP